MKYNLILLSYYTFLISLSKKSVQNIFLSLLTNKGALKTNVCKELMFFVEQL